MFRSFRGVELGNIKFNIKYCVDMSAMFADIKSEVLTIDMDELENCQMVNNMFQHAYIEHLDIKNIRTKGILNMNEFMKDAHIGYLEVDNLNITGIQRKDDIFANINVREFYIKDRTLRYLLMYYMSMNSCEELED